MLQLRWLAEQGDANAAYLLGRSIEQGIGGDSRKERDAFLLWYRVAAAMGQPETAERLKKLGVPASIANHKWPLPKLPAQMPPNVEWNPETVGEQSTNSDSNKIYARGASS